MYKMTYKNIEDLHKDFPWKSIKKFSPLAKRYGFSESEVISFLKRDAVHDVKAVKPKYLHIYDKVGDGWQFDTLIQKKSNPWLVFININTRKVRVFKMKNKGKKEVMIALESFFKEEPNAKSLTSDQDAAYLNNDVLSYLKNKNIRYYTTEDNNHNILGIINRFMRTLRDLNQLRDIDDESMLRLVSNYNETPHESLNDKSPNEITKEDEDTYIKEKDIEARKTYDFAIGDHVRLLIEKNKIGKNRSNYSSEAYIIDGKSGNQFLIKSTDGSVDSVPGWKIIKCDSRYKIAKTIKNEKRGVIEKILDYKNGKYTVVYDEGTEDLIPVKNLREGAPLKLSSMERLFWIKQKYIPPEIRKWI